MEIANAIFEENEDIDDLFVLDFLENRIPRQIYERSHYFDTLDEVAFRRRFRLSRESVLYILDIIQEHLEYPYDVNNSISPINQLLVCLRLFSTGGHLQSVADFVGMHVSTVCRIVKKVSNAIASKYQQFVVFHGNQDTLRQRQQNFFNIASFPRVIGALDCTHIKIQSPGGEEAEIYRNRKGYFSINTQMICDSKLRILNVVARWPGATHDATIFNNSRVNHSFENNEFRNCILLGDSGYPIRNYLMTPLLQPHAPAEHLYNESHIRTRNVIERCFGVLKRRFPILAYGCRLSLDTVLSVIVAASILHNIALNMNDEEAPPIPEELDEHVLNHLIEEGQIPHAAEDQENGGAIFRRNLINEYFGQL